MARQDSFSARKIRPRASRVWEGVLGWTGLPLTISPRTKVRLRRIRWEDLQVPCELVFVTVNREARMGRVVEVDKAGFWLASEASSSRYYWERELIHELASMVEVPSRGKLATG